MSSLVTIYNFETPIENAVVSLLTANSITAIGSDDPIELQKDRPRVEVFFQLNSASDSRAQQCPDGVYRHDLYSGTLTLACVTETQSDHKTYRANVRSIMSSFYNASLSDLEIRYVIPQGTSPIIKPESGYFVSNLNYEVRFNVKSTSWPT